MEAVATNKMLRLTEKQLDIKLNFISNYINSSNAATGSTFDANSNVTSKNVGTLMAEINKDINIQIKRRLICTELDNLFGDEISKLYIKQLEDHLIYCHDETATVLPYCAAVSMYPFFESGLQTFGGDSKAPQHLSSYCGGYINLVFGLSSQFAGAIATVEFLVGFDHYAKIDYGDNYLEEYESIIKQELQQVVYAINQPASSRGYQSCFINWSIFDSHYFNTLFHTFVFPDGTRPDWEHINKLQKYFLKWFNEERTKALLTFPVVTVAMLRNNEEILDKEYENLVAEELSKGNSFFIYLSDSVDSLSSCCRLKNDIKDQINDFQYSLGAGGIQTGSINVLTLNVNRFVQNCYKEVEDLVKNTSFNITEYISYKLKDQVLLMHKYQLGFRSFFDSLINKGMMPAYSANFIDISKQYCTIGINGVLESAEFLGYDCKGSNEEYKDYLKTIFKTISEANKESKAKYDVKFNCEIVPAESLGVKFATWDKKDKYVVPRNCYNSYLYAVEDENVNLVDKFILHGNEIMQYMDGGQLKVA